MSGSLFYSGEKIGKILKCLLTNVEKHDIIVSVSIIL